MSDKIELINEPGMKITIEGENGIFGIHITSPIDLKNQQVKDWTDETKKYVSLIYLYMALNLIGKKE